MEWKSPLLCSIDAEFTGFDIERDELIELGMLFFRITPSGIETESEWVRTFKPGQNVKTKILGLTGIQNDELESATPLESYLGEIKKLLEKPILVGHNLAVDLRFLEAVGIQPKNGYIDTQDLVQFILPSFDSYNLEHLAFSLKISETQQHRALSDAKTTANLLYKLLAHYQTYPQTLKSQASEVVDSLFFGQALSWPVLPSPIPSQPGQSQDYSRSALYIEATQNTPSVLVKKSSKQLNEMWRQGDLEVDTSPKGAFASLKFSDILKQPYELSHYETIAALKVLVWLHTNWQTASPLDLNTSLSGGFVERIATNPGGEWTEKETAVVGMDFSTSAHALEKDLYRNRHWFIEDLDQYEQFLSKASEKSFSWASLLKLTRDNIDYNPSKLENTLASIDLFFGVLAVSLKRYSYLGGEVSVDDLDDYTRKQLEEAAARLAATLRKVFAHADNSKLLAATDLLADFFSVSATYARWIEISDIQYRLISREIHPKKSILDNLLRRPYHGNLIHITEKSAQYILNRLRIASKAMQVSEEGPNFVKPEILDLTDNGLFRTVAKNLPCVIIFNNHSEAVRFYESYGLELKKHASLFLHRYSGGLSKTLKNFGLRTASVLLTTHESISGSPVVIQPKTIIYQNIQIPAQPQHAYERIVAKRASMTEKEAAIINFCRIQARTLLNFDASSVEKIIINTKNLSSDDFANMFNEVANAKTIIIHKEQR